jgi:hypothetical protein
MVAQRIGEALADLGEQLRRDRPAHIVAALMQLQDYPFRNHGKKHIGDFLSQLRPFNQ